MNEDEEEEEETEYDNLLRNFTQGIVRGYLVNYCKSWGQLAHKQYLSLHVT